MALRTDEAMRPAQVRQELATSLPGGVNLYDDLKRRIAEATRSRHAMLALDWIFGRPVFPSARFAAGAGIPRQSGHRILSELRRYGILNVIQASSGNQSAVLSFPDLLDIVDGRGDAL